MPRLALVFPGVHCVPVFPLQVPDAIYRFPELVHQGHVSLVILVRALQDLSGVDGPSYGPSRWLASEETSKTV